MYVYKMFAMKTLSALVATSVLILCHVQGSIAECETPPASQLTYGFLGKAWENARTFVTNQLVEVVCKMGGKVRLICGDNRKWSVLATGKTSCEEPKCGEPPEYDSAEKIVSGSGIGAKVRYTCKEGYVHIDDKNETLPYLEKTCKEKCKTKKKVNPCRIDWSNRKRKFHCKVPSNVNRCILPPDPNRIINEEDSDFGDLNWIKPGDYVEMDCKEGFTSPTLSFECLEEGTWDEGEVRVCEEVQCTVPRLPSGVSLESKEGPYQYKEKLRVTCDLEDHIFMKVQQPTLQITCQNSGWSNAITECRRISCPYIQEPEDGVILQQASISYVGDSVTVQCLGASKLRGSRTRWCTKYGTWNGTLQVCVLDEGGCGNPGVPISGTKIGDSYDVGDEVRFTCDTDTVLLGATIRRCQRNNEWSGRQPICRGKGQFQDPEEAATEFRAAMDTKAHDTRSSQELQDIIHHYQTKDVYIGNVSMKNYNSEARTPLGDLNKNGLNLYLLFDTSESIDQEDFLKAISFAKGVVKKLGVSRQPSGTSVSFAAFNTAIWNKTLSQPDRDDLQSVLTGLDDLGKHPPNGGTSLEAALDELFDVMIPHHSLARGPQSKAAHAAIILTDGLYNTGKHPKERLDEARKQAIKGIKLEIFCVGVGNVDVELLKSIATSSEPEHLIYLRNYTQLQAMDIIFTSRQNFSRCGEFRGYRHVFNKTVEESEKFWPWMAAVFYTNGDVSVDNRNQHEQIERSEHVCGASIIRTSDFPRSSWLLTAAHCVHGRDKKNFVVKIGSYSSDKYDRQKSLLVFVKRYIKHPDYEHSHLEKDIALIELAEAVEFESNVRPVCLPTQDQQGMYSNGRQGEVTGWGGKRKDEPSVVNLKTIEVKVTDIPECKTSLSSKGVTSTVDDTWNFCAGLVPHRDKKSTVQDSCAGDSGGPLVFHKEDDHGDFVFSQGGIVSFGDEECGTGQIKVPGVYTKVAKFADWIREHAKEAEQEA